jgi:hypothetical protein
MTTATAPIKIDPDALYDDDMLYGLLMLSSQTLTRARRSGQLRYIRKGQRILYVGKWVLAWLMRDNEEAPSG